MIVAPQQEACNHRMVEKMRQLKDKIDDRNVRRYLKYDVFCQYSSCDMIAAIRLSCVRLCKSKI